MRIGIVAYELEGRPTGVGRVLEGLLGGALALGRGWRYVLFFHGGAFESPLFASPDVEPVFAGRAGSAIVWEQLVLPRALRRARLDLVYSPSYSLPPFPGVPGVVSMHDISFELCPDEFRWRERTRRRWLARRACRAAARVLVPLERVAREVRDRYALPDGRVGVLGYGVDSRFAPGEPGTVEAPYLLHVGSLLERRNVPLMLAVTAELRREHPGLRLVLAGPNRMRRPAELAAGARELGLDGAVLELGYVDEAALPGLYRGAAATLQLSSYEGYGFPPLESLACATPAVASRGQALDELWPDYPFLCSAVDLAQVCAVTRRALAGVERERVVAEGPARMRAVDWRASAGRWLDELESARASVAS